MKIESGNGPIARELAELTHLRSTAAALLVNSGQVLAQADPGQVTGVIILALLKERDHLPSVATLTNLEAARVEQLILDWGTRIRARRAGHDRRD